MTTLCKPKYHKSSHTYSKCKSSVNLRENSPKTSLLNNNYHTQKAKNIYISSKLRNKFHNDR